MIVYANDAQMRQVIASYRYFKPLKCEKQCVNFLTSTSQDDHKGLLTRKECGQVWQRVEDLQVYTDQ